MYYAYVLPLKPIFFTVPNLTLHLYIGIMIYSDGGLLINYPRCLYDIYAKAFIKDIRPLCDLLDFIYSGSKSLVIVVLDWYSQL